MTPSSGSSPTNPGEINLPGDQAPSLEEAPVFYSASFSGPLPPAQELGRYDDVLPGTAERIIAMAEREQAARHGDSERLAATTRRSQFFALYVAGGMMAVGMTVTIAGHPAVGGIAFGTTFAAVVAAFLRQRTRGDRDSGQ
ncbi:MAG: DUF2335 domain-containing protein [Planctomycetota bacterium]